MVSAGMNTGNTSGIAVRRRATALNVELVGIGPMFEGRHGFNEQSFGADEQNLGRGQSD